MGYLCPVCEEPFGDDQQCANHLAVTAILHGGPHETWLADAVDERAAADETVDWEAMPRADLAALVADRAAETTDHDHPGDHTHPVEGANATPTGESTVPTDRLPGQQGNPAITEGEPLDADAQAILREARELTDRMQERGPDSVDERKES